MIFNAVETAGLTDRTRAVPRFPPAILVCVELLTIVLCAIAAVHMALLNSALALEEGILYQGFIADPWRMYCVYLQASSR